MSTLNPETSQGYTIGALLDDKTIMAGIHPLGSEGLKYMLRVSCFSTVPSFLGGLIGCVTEEVTPQIPLRGNVQTVEMDAGLASGGDSNLLPTTREVALRVYGHEFPTDWEAVYALAYGCGIAGAKIYRHAMTEDEQKQVVYTNPWILKDGNYPTIALYLPQVEFNANKRFSPSPDMLVCHMGGNESQNIWGLIGQQAQLISQLFGGYTLFFEYAAKAPTGLLNQISHFVAKYVNRFPSIDELDKAQNIVNFCFKNRSHFKRVYLEAQRLNVPIFDPNAG